MDNSVCPKCSGALEEGFIAHQTEAGHKLLAWQSGVPEHTRLFGMTLSTIKVPSEGLSVSVFRCARCGFLEMYAP